MKIEQYDNLGSLQNTIEGLSIEDQRKVWSAACRYLGVTTAEALALIPTHTDTPANMVFALVLTAAQSRDLPLPANHRTLRHPTLRDVPYREFHAHVNYQRHLHTYRALLGVAR